MPVTAVFPTVPQKAGMYESFYLRAVVPTGAGGGVAAIHGAQTSRREATGSLWCTVFDARRGRPFMYKLTSERLSDAARGMDRDRRGEARPRPGRGRVRGASWSLR